MVDFNSSFKKYINAISEIDSGAADYILNLPEDLICRFNTELCYSSNLCVMFNWGDTPQGYVYWLNLSIKLQTHTWEMFNDQQTNR